MLVEQLRGISADSELSGLVANVDIPAIVGEFLSETNVEDVIVEVIQNDLDQGATRTEIHFDEFSFSTVGNGRPVDAAGWKRLEMVMGAGGSIESKLDGIGTKNHGLRTLFGLGNRIWIRSDGFRTVQVVTRDDQFLEPGSWSEKRVDPEPVTTGCLIEVPYRQKPVVPRHSGSDAPTLQPPSKEDLLRIVEGFARSAPWRLLGCVTPWNDSSAEYVLTLHHYALPGPHVFKCRLMRGATNQDFQRVCEHRDPDGRVTIHRERAISFAIQPPKGARVPWFYRVRGGRVRVEISWPLDARGRRIQASTGGFRYPLGYPERTRSSGFSFSAPYVSDTPRHAQAAGRANFNDTLTNELVQRLPQVMKSVVLKDYGPQALDLLRLPNGSTDDDAISACVDACAIPSTKPYRGAFHVPLSTNDLLRHDRTVAAWIPKRFPQLAENAPDWFRTWLVKRGTNESWHIIRRHDLVDLLRPPLAAKICPWPSEAAWHRFMSSPAKVAKLLDCLMADPEPKRRRWNLEAVHLPDRRGTPVPIAELHRSRSVPPHIPGTEAPQLLHPSLVKHAALQRGPLKIRPFDESAHALRVDSQSLKDQEIEALSTWVMERAPHLKMAALKHLKTQPIWPTREGQYVEFSKLCEPKQKTVIRILGEYLLRPSKALRDLRALRKGSVAPLSIRSNCIMEEVQRWYGATSDEADTCAQITQLEDDMEALANIKGYRAMIKRFGPTHQTNTASGGLALVQTLHTSDLDREFWSPSDTVVSKKARAPLMGLLGVRSKPDPEALVRALVEDVQSSLFERRLGALFKASEAEQLMRQLAERKIVPWKKGSYSPSEISLAGGRFSGDLWGDWRFPVPESQFSNLTARHLVQLGAVSTTLTQESSVQFFQWLHAQAPEVVFKHRVQIARHWLAARGPGFWAEHHPDLPCLPVILKGAFVLLAHQNWNRARLPDSVTIAQAFIDQRSTLPIVWSSLQPDWDPTRRLQKRISSLRETAKPLGPPKVESPGERLHDCEAVLASLSGQAMRRRLGKELLEIAGPELELRRVQSWTSLTRTAVVRGANGLSQSFKVGRHKAAKVSVSYSFSDNTLWLVTKESGIPQGFFQALAEKMLEGNPLPMHALALGSAIERARVRQSGLQWTPSDLSPGEQHRSPDPGTRGGTPRHHPMELDPAGNLPGDTDLKDADGASSDGDPSSSAGSSSRKYRRRSQRSSGRSFSEIEAEHRMQLFKLYASHCQACLALHEPTVLAPPRTYVSAHEIRRRILHTHHVVSFASSGARHAGNLLLLCELHHRNIGDRIPPQPLTHALEKAVKMNRTFASEGEELTVEGLLVVVDGPAGEERFFFHPKHRQYWLQKASV